MSKKDKIAGDLKPAAHNPRKIAPEQLAALARAMSEFGDLSGIVFNKRTNQLVGGHMRNRIFQKDWPIVITERLDAPNAVGTVAEGYIETPWGHWVYREVDWPIKTESAAMIAANKHGGDWDIIMLKEQLVDLADGEFDLSLTGFSEDELKKLIDWQGNVPEKDDEVQKPPVVPVTSPGDLYILGDHRLLCGDSTITGDVERLFSEWKAGMLLTDPPYGVNYVGKTKDALKIENDDYDEASLSVLVKSVFDLAQKVCRGGAYWYATVPAGPFHLIFAQDWKDRGILRQIMVWVKDSMVLGHSEYHYKHEPILYGWTPGDRHKNSDRTRTTVWDFARPKRSEEHPTMKPVELWSKAIMDGSVQGEIVYDPFMGSGTTIIACEQLNRKAFGMELSPNYCDAIVARWEKYSGEKAVLQKRSLRKTERECRANNGRH